MNNPWNQLSTYFDTHKDEDEIPAGAADNIFIAWPSILKIIKENSSCQSQAAADLGCGAGGFVNKLSGLAFNVMGIDPSSGMIDIARKGARKGTQFIVGDSSQLLKGGRRFGLITSVMALQFVKNLEQTAQHILQALTEDGIVVFAVFNPAYVIGYLKAHTLFEGFEEEE